MGATATEQEQRCSCGRTFAHEISLKRHRWVTGHAEGAPVVAAPVVAKAAAVSTVDADETYRQAVAVLVQKRLEYEALMERQHKAQQRKALVNEFGKFIQSALAGVLQAAQSSAHSTASVFSTLANMALKLVVLMALALSLIFSGMGVGRLIATQADAQSSAVSVNVAP